MYLLNIHPTEIFFALSDLTRLRIIRLLSQSQVAEACSCDLSEALGEPEYNVSKQLKILRSVGLLTAEKEGRWIYHRIRKDDAELSHLLRVVAAFSDPAKQFEGDLKRFKRVAGSRLEKRCAGKVNSAVSRTQARSS